MKCPACREPLVVVEREGIEVDWCAGCGGLWFDAGEIELLAVATGREAGLAFSPPAGSAPEAAQRRCPRCARRMEERALAQEPPVLLDFCASGHGIWFDRGELGAFVQALPRLPGEGPARDVAGFLGEVFRAPTPPAERA
ncbi:MAG: zf-TFIIB domain-containing protein [Candidatus Eisenbacteria bacterium]|uniref:Zf-TFIIB domain-containing protein n=1 Tax=Eiseniibacteriota bacterium TaxID=2212470 RepID=A0A938BRA3_UNCEI|nr:zf-TFIIB domain-containing protein [Candidatus Eisenbacteria bacterium]